MLDQLARVLRPDGLLLISSPNRGHYVPGNPHHRHEYTPLECKRRWRVASARSDCCPSTRCSRGDQCTPRAFRRHAHRATGGARASRTRSTLWPSPGQRCRQHPRRLVALTQFLEIRQWLERFQGQERVLDEQARSLRSSRLCVASVTRRSRGSPNGSRPSPSCRSCASVWRRRKRRCLLWKIRLPRSRSALRSSARGAGRRGDARLGQLAITAPLRAIKRLARPPR